VWRNLQASLDNEVDRVRLGAYFGFQSATTELGDQEIGSIIYVAILVGFGVQITHDSSGSVTGQIGKAGQR
jgi:hypothetical protein